MTEKRELPSIAGDLTPPQPKRKLDLKAIQPSAALDDTTVAANSIALGQKWGAMTSLAEEGQSRPVTDGAPKPRQRRPLATEKLQIEVPDYLGAELAARAGAERVTK
ncbi:MAG: hypothetical protein JO010_06805 [Alphaproteobacteria bacterium]|nr:hypothetical protein [Alphaproteobacteria bacterium]